MNRYSLTASVFALSLCLVGCNQATQETAATDDTPAAEELAVTEVILTALKNADAFDGSEDKVVSKCYSCQLGMDGDAKYTSKVGDYTCNFCKDLCREHFEQDPEYFLTNVEIPEESSHDHDGHDHDHDGQDHDGHDHEGHDEDGPEQ